MSETPKTTIRGRVWKLGDDVDTDEMAPWSTITEGWEQRRASMMRSRPGFVDQVRPGDLIVAGRNWGCGSSREQAPENLRDLGIAAVVAESFARIYFRNCIAIAFPNVACPGIHTACEEGDDLEVDLQSGRVVNHTRGTELEAERLSGEMLEIIRQGGLLAALEARVRAGELS